MQKQWVSFLHKRICPVVTEIFCQLPVFSLTLNPVFLFHLYNKCSQPRSSLAASFIYASTYWVEEFWQFFFLNIFWGDFFSYCIQHCFICRPSDSTVSTDAGIELLQLVHWQSEALTTRLDLIRTRLDLNWMSAKYSRKTRFLNSTKSSNLGYEATCLWGTFTHLLIPGKERKCISKTAER
jgi:hypothetical protein